MEELAGKLKLSEGTEKAVNASDSRFYNKITSSSRKRCDTGSM